LDGGFWANGLMMGVCFFVNYMTSSSDPRANIVARSIFRFYAKIRVFRALDQVSSVSALKVMPKIFQICQEFPRSLRGFPILIFYHFFH